MKLGKKINGSLDRPGHKLRKKGNVKGKFPEVVFRSPFAAIDVNGIAERLECVK